MSEDFNQLSNRNEPNVGMNEETARKNTDSFTAYSSSTKQHHPSENEYCQNWKRHISEGHEIGLHQFQHGHHHYHPIQSIPQNYMPDKTESFHSQQIYSEQYFHTVKRNEREVSLSTDQYYPLIQQNEQIPEALFPPQVRNYSQPDYCSCLHRKQISGYEFDSNPVMHESNHRILDDMPHQQKTYAHNPNIGGIFYSENQRPHNYSLQQTGVANISQEIQQLKEFLMKQMDWFELRFKNMEAKIETLQMKQKHFISDKSNSNSNKESTTESSSDECQPTTEHNKQDPVRYTGDNSKSVQHQLDVSLNRSGKQSVDCKEQNYHQDLQTSGRNTAKYAEMNNMRETMYLNEGQTPIQHAESTKRKQLKKKKKSQKTKGHKEKVTTYNFLDGEKSCVKKFEETFTSDRPLKGETENLDNTIKSNDDEFPSGSSKSSEFKSSLDHSDLKHINSHQFFGPEKQDAQESEEIYLQTPTYSSDIKKIDEVIESIPFLNNGPLKKIGKVQGIIDHLANAFNEDPLEYVANNVANKGDIGNKLLNAACKTAQLIRKKKSGFDIFTSVAANLLGDEIHISDDSDDSEGNKRRRKYTFLPLIDNVPDYRNYCSSADNYVGDKEVFKEEEFQHFLRVDSKEGFEEEITCFQTDTINNCNSDEKCNIVENIETTISNETINFLSKNLTLGECQTLCRALGLSDGIINDTKIEQQHLGCEENRYVLLQKWKQQYKRSATNGKLIKELLSLKRGDIIQILFPEYVKHHPRKEIFYKIVALSNDSAKDLLQVIQAFLKPLYQYLKLPIPPWMECKNLSLEKLYVDLTMFPKDKDDLEEKGKEIILQDIFKEVYGEHPNRILLEGPPGYGKSTLTYKLALDWAKNETYMNKFYLLFVVALRSFKGNLEETLINECDLEDIDDATKLAVIKHYEKHVLLVLDGYDELSDSHKASLNALLRGEKFPRMTVLLTSRTGLFKLPMKKEEYNQRTGGLVSSQKRKQQSFWRKRIEIKGISEDKRKQFLQTYLNINADKLYGKLNHVMSNEMRNLYECPLILLLLALLVEDKGFEQIKTKTDLYKEVFNFIVRRSLVREELINKEVHVDLFASNNNEPYFNLLIKFGKFALKNLAKYSLMFSEKEILENCENDQNVLKLGFLTKNVKFSRHQRIEFFEPVHKTFLEFLGALFLWYLGLKPDEEHVEFETMMASLVKDKVMEQKDSLLFTFLAGLLENKTTILLKSLARWSYALNLDDFPISAVTKEIQHFQKFNSDLIPFISPVFQQKDSCQNDFNKTVTSFAIQEKRIKIISLNVHKMTNIPMEIIADIVQLDIWGKDMKDQIQFKNNPHITCKYLFCWIYGIREENWNCYAQFIHSIKTEEISFIINAYDDYKQIPMILKKMKNELANGLWKGMNIKFLKVLGLDGKNDRESLPLIEKFVQNKMINNGLVISIKSMFSAFETFSFWFKTRFLRAFMQTTKQFLKYLQSLTCFREHLKPQIQPIASEVKQNIKKLMLTFASTIKIFEKSYKIFDIECLNDSSCDEINFVLPLFYGYAEENMYKIFKQLQEEFTKFHVDLQSIFHIIETNNTLEMLFSSLRDFNRIVNGFCVFLNSFTDIFDFPNDDDRELGIIEGLSGVALLAKHGVTAFNTFNKEINFLMNSVKNSNLQRFALSNGYCSLKIPTIDLDSVLAGKTWNYFHIENKINISSNVKRKNIGKFRVHNLGIILYKENVEKETSLLLSCSDLHSLSCDTNLLYLLKEKSWTGLKTLKELYWYPCDEDAHVGSDLLNDFMDLRLLAIMSGGITSTYCKIVPHLLFHSLKVLEIREIGSENVKISKLIIRNMLEDSQQDYANSVHFKNTEMDVLPQLEELKLDLENVLDDDDLTEIFLGVKELLLTMTVIKFTLVGPNEFHEPLITELFSFDETFKIIRGIDIFHDQDLMFFHQDVRSSNDIKIQWTISLSNV